jgi:hypothetical protein
LFKDVWEDESLQGWEWEDFHVPKSSVSKTTEKKETSLIKLYHRLNMEEVNLIGLV